MAEMPDLTPFADDRTIVYHGARVMEIITPTGTSLLQLVKVGTLHAPQMERNLLKPARLSPKVLDGVL